MEKKVRVRVVKCQLLVACLFIMLLAFGGCFMTAITGLGGHFTTLTTSSPADSLARGMHYSMVLYGGTVCAFLFISIFISTASVLRESQQLMVIAIMVFGCLFCALAAGTTWTHMSQREVEDSFLDVYDGLFDQVVRGTAGGQREHLLRIHEKFQCCGKISWSPELVENEFLRKNITERQDCVLVISTTLNTHWRYVTILLLLTLGFTVYGMILSSFLYFSFPRGTSWDRRGEYSLTNRLSCPQGHNLDTPLTHLLPHQTIKNIG
uniref:Tetraspanin 32 n=1 Tax=Leptobrachium leishanense TaxID=445787 RepID=A0A8C5QZ71_9ANUR